VLKKSFANIVYATSRTMSTNRFFYLLLLVSLGVGLSTLLFAQFFDTFRLYNDVTWWSLCVFVPLSIIMFLVGQSAAKNVNKYLFSNLIVHFTVIKLLFSLLSVVMYKKIYHPESKFFIVPFALVYVVFTIFETFFMVKLTKPKP
jgi:hypothetical protein